MSHRHRRARRNGAAIRKALIHNLQVQVKAANSLLARAQSQVGLSEQELQAAASDLHAAKSAIDAAKQEEREALAELQQIEEDILAEQSADTPFGQAQAAIDQAMHDMHLAFLTATGITAAEIPSGQTFQMTLNRLDADQKQLLENDEAYQATREAVSAAVRQRDDLRQQLIFSDPEWQAANQELKSAKSELQAAQSQGLAAGQDGYQAKSHFRNANEVAAEAQAFIQVAQSRLRMLGA